MKAGMRPLRAVRFFRVRSRNEQARRGLMHRLRPSNRTRTAYVLRISGSYNNTEFQFDPLLRAESRH